MYHLLNSFLKNMYQVYGIVINKPIVYRFVKYNEGAYGIKVKDKVLLGTFHEWNNTYYIDISFTLYEDETLKDIVIHETRHMIVQYLRDEDIIDLTKYTEEIAYNENVYYNNIFDSGVYLLKNSQDDKEK